MAHVKYGFENKTSKNHVQYLGVAVEKAIARLARLFRNVQGVEGEIDLGGVGQWWHIPS